MSNLLELGIIKNNTTSSTVFENLLEDGRSFLDVEYTYPHEYVLQYWEIINTKPEYTSLAGNLFELIICTLLYRENLLPLYIQACVAFVPNVKFDSLLYNKAYSR